MEGLLLAYTMFDRILPDCVHGTTALVIEEYSKS